mgnify:FL=1
MNGPLSGIRVLDLSRVLAGPFATQILADLGADVIKIERSGAGDDTREWGPPWLVNDEGATTEESAYFLSCNRGKRSVALELTDPRAQSIVRALARTSDVLIENFKPGTLGRMGLDYDSLSQTSPGLVYCSISGFGQDGPNAAKAGYDAMIQAQAGLMSITGEHGRGPVKVGVAVIDMITGLYAANAIQAALIQRQNSGRGSWIDTALFDSAVAILANQGMNHLIAGEIPERLGSAHPNIVPYQSFPTLDGDLFIAVGNDMQFRRFCEIASADWADDPRFASNSQRVANRHLLVPLISERMRTRSKSEWRRTLDDANIPCGPVQDLEEVFADPQVEARGLRFDLPHTLHTHLPQIANPLRFDGRLHHSERAPPLRGEHTHEVLLELGYNEALIDELAATGAIELAM